MSDTDDENTEKQQQKTRSRSNSVSEAASNAIKNGQETLESTRQYSTRQKIVAEQANVEGASGLEDDSNSRNNAVEEQLSLTSSLHQREGSNSSSIARFLDPNELGVQERRVQISRDETRPVDWQGEFGKPVQSKRRETLNSQKARFSELGMRDGAELAEMTQSQRAEFRSQNLDETQRIHTTLQHSESEAAKMDRAAEKVQKNPTAKVVRKSAGGYDESFNSASQAAYYEGQNTAINAADLTNEQRIDVLKTQRSQISRLNAIRTRTSSSQGRDDLGQGPAHPTNKKTEENFTPEMRQASATIHSHRASAIGDAASAANGIEESTALMGRVAAAATANSFAMATAASNYTSNSSSEEQQRQQSDHENLKKLSGSLRTGSQRAGAPNASHRDRSVSPKRLETSSQHASGQQESLNQGADPSTGEKRGRSTSRHSRAMSGSSQSTISKSRSRSVKRRRTDT